MVTASDETLAGAGGTPWAITCGVAVSSKDDGCALPPILVCPPADIAYLANRAAANPTQPAPWLSGGHDLACVDGMQQPSRIEDPAGDLAHDSTAEDYIRSVA